MRHTRIIVTHYGGPDALQVIEEEMLGEGGVLGKIVLLPNGNSRMVGHTEVI